MNDKEKYCLRWKVRSFDCMRRSVLNEQKETYSPPEEWNIRSGIAIGVCGQEFGQYFRTTLVYADIRDQSCFCVPTLDVAVHSREPRRDFHRLLPQSEYRPGIN